MKFYYRIIFFTIPLLHIFVLSIDAQPQKPRFYEAEPLLAYPLNYENLKDENGNSIPGYDRIYGADALIRDSFIITVARTSLPMTFFDDGFVVLKHNIFTGELFWKDIYNFHNGSDGYFTHFESRFDKDGNVEIFGVKDTANIFPFRYSFRRVYDFDTGKVLVFDYDPDNKISIPDRYGLSIATIKKDSMYLNIYVKLFGWPDTSRYKIVASLVNGKLDSLIVPVIFEQEIIPDFPVNDFSLESSYFLNINDSISALYITMRENKTSLYKTSSKLIFIKHKDINNIHVFKVKNLEEVVPFNLLYPRNIQIDVRDGGIVLMDYDIVFPGPVGKPWVWRMDAEGNDLDFWYDIQISGSKYTNTFFLHANDTLAYIKCWPSIKSKQGFDIITIDKNKYMKYLASVTTKHENPNAFYNASVRHSNFIAQDSILIFNGTFSDGVSRENFAYWVMTFNLNDLIRGSAVATQEVDRLADINIYPNPSSDDVYIECDEHLEWKLLDIGGAILKNGDGTIIDLSPYPASMYILSIQAKNGLVYKKIIKTD